MRAFITCVLTFRSCCSLLSLASRELEERKSNNVVQVHESLDDIEDDKEKIRLSASTIMTTKAGQRLECFLPDTVEPDAKDSHHVKEKVRLAYGNNAFHHIKPGCLLYSEKNVRSLHEVCPGLVIRKISSKDLSDEDLLSIESNGDLSSLNQREHAKKHYFISADLALADDYNGEKRVESLDFDTQETVFTQYFVSSVQKDKFSEPTYKVQYICQTGSHSGDEIVAVHTSKSDSSMSFLLASRVFCDRRYTSNYGDLYPVASAIMADLSKHACVKRIDGWWSYEICLNVNIRQYHEQDGQITANFVLGNFDHSENENLLKTGKAMVFEHIDSTEHVMKPALVQIYNDGTTCEGESDDAKLRESKVYIFCERKNVDTIQILSIGETQTCQYSIKISTAAVCNHPHFIPSTAATENQSKIVHCVPEQLSR
uniref:Uncharacterized protein AlNc14C36G3161 n=1 Tax=Albugo laibachii Nc14 TaxID=890382 RepID=F0W8N5_9STRA|nr:conserved hypothetical protein [Albugo laibachii Nc14]|eukprot:CCA17492.1 conserved hypothetical protein [Albugo laibachii Nc14]